MSEMEAHKGKLTPMVLEGVTPEERAESACKIFGCDRDPGMTWEETMREYMYDAVIVIGDVTYKIENKELDPYGYVEATKNDDGSIDYSISFYNGGAGLHEVLESAVKDVD